MRKRSPIALSRCFPLSRINLLVLFLFAASIWNYQDYQHQGFAAVQHDDIQTSRGFPSTEASSVTRTASPTVLRVSSKENDSNERESVESKASEMKSTNNEDSNTLEKPASQHVASIPSFCSEYKPEREVAIWIPASPDLSIASRVQKSMGGLSDKTSLASNQERSYRGESNSSDGTKNVAKELCPFPTSQVKIVSRCPHWILQAFDVNGNPKTVGGDEFYVTYHDRPLDTTNVTSRSPASTTIAIAIAKLQDLSNGTYVLNFIQSPFSPQWRLGHLLRNGTIAVTFQYTCGLGSWNPPAKERWKSSGAIAVTHSYYPVHSAPPIEPFVPPTIRMNWESSNDRTTAASPTRFYLDWTKDSFSDYGSSSNATPREESSYKEPHILAFGDSLMQQFIKSWKQTEIPNVGMPLNTTTVHDWIQLLERRIGAKLKALTNSRKSESTIGTLIVGSSTWDLLEPQTGGWEDHASAMKTLIGFIQENYLRKSKNLHLVWKSPTALHVHVPILETEALQKKDDGYLTKLHERIKYMSSSRSHELYTIQKRVCSSLKIPFLDIYETSYVSADHTQVGDGRHYNEEFNQYTLQSFLKYSSVEHFWYRYQCKISKSKSNRILSVRYCPDSWVDVIQAVLLAALTNRRLECDSVKPCDGWKKYEPVLTQCSGLNASLKRSTGSKWNVATLDEKLQLPLSLDALVENSWIPKNIGSPSYQVAMEAFDYGTSYLYGMIWYNLLSKTLSGYDNYHEQDASQNPNRLVLSVHDSVGRGDIRKCVSELLKPAVHLYGKSVVEKLGCKVLFTFERDRKLWKDTLQNEYNCTAELLSWTGKVRESERHNGDANVDQSLIWHQAHAIATMAKDGFIARCDEPSNIIFNSLMRYVRTKDEQQNRFLARKERDCCI
ncbi:MAG: hypothetical protein SGBAC_007910 [Bacillariaceae sp.]